MSVRGSLSNKSKVMDQRLLNIITIIMEYNTQRIIESLLI